MIIPLIHWKIRAVNPPPGLESLNVFQPCTPPFSGVSVMVAAGLFPDPVLQTSKNRFPLLEGMVWEAVTALPSDIPAGTEVEFESLDTLCSVFADGVCLGQTDNQFRRYRFTIPPGTAGLTLIFDCARTESKRRAEMWETPMDWNGFSYTGGFYYPFIRKAAYAGGWDWLNTVPLSAGIGAEVRLHIPKKEEMLIRHVRYEVELSHDLSCAVVRPDALIFSESVQTAVAEIRADGIVLHETVLLRLQKGEHHYPLPAFTLHHPRLWFPHQLGSQSTYAFSLNIKGKGGWVKHETLTGIRKVRLLHGSDGKEFQLEINNRPFQARGANWIPCDPYPDRVPFKTVEKRLELAKEAHMNLIRVWGGGFYESEAFYSLCDRLGLMVWQDFPFACNYYPAELADSIRIEADEQLQRLAHHPSLILLCGNNECHCCHYDWLQNSGKPFPGELYYHNILPKAVQTNCPEIPYWPGSPWNPPDPTRPSSADAGDRHAWQCVFGSAEDKADPGRLAADNGHFISETGFVAMPDIRSLQETGAADFETAEGRANYAVTPERLREFIRAYTRRNAPEELPDFCLESQQAQAFFLGHAVDAWRRRNISGILLWHLADCWTAPSWGVIDGQNRPRLLHTTLKRVFAPDHLSYAEGRLYRRHDFEPEHPRLELNYLDHNREKIEVAFNEESLPFPPERPFRAKLFDGEKLLAALTKK